MVTTYTGIVPISGSNDFGIGAPFEIAEFHPQDHQLYDVGLPSGIYVGSVIEPEDFILSDIVSFNVRTNQVYGAGSALNPIYPACVVIDGARDFTFAHRTASSGITVVNFGFGTGFTFTVTPVSNRRIFPTAVADATLFPGDVPRGSPLNP